MLCAQTGNFRVINRGIAVISLGGEGRERWAPCFAAPRTIEVGRARASVRARTRARSRIGGELSFVLQVGA